MPPPPEFDENKKNMIALLYCDASSENDNTLSCLEAILRCAGPLTVKSGTPRNAKIDMQDRKQISWTDTEDRCLAQMLLEGKTIADIVLALEGRTESAIRSRIDKKGFRKRVKSRNNAKQSLAQSSPEERLMSKFILAPQNVNEDTANARIDGIPKVASTLKDKTESAIFSQIVETETREQSLAPTLFERESTPEVALTSKKTNESAIPSQTVETETTAHRTRTIEEGQSLARTLSEQESTPEVALTLKDTNESAIPSQIAAQILFEQESTPEVASTLKDTNESAIPSQIVETEKRAQSTWANEDEQLLTHILSEKRPVSEMVMTLQDKIENEIHARVAKLLEQQPRKHITEGSRWTDEEDRRLARMLLDKRPVSEMALVLKGRAEKAIRSRIAKIKIQKRAPEVFVKGKRWIDGEKRSLIEMVLKGMPMSEMIARLETRTEIAISAQVKRLGIEGDRRIMKTWWTDEERKSLIKMCQDGRPMSSILPLLKVRSIGADREQVDKTVWREKKRTFSTELPNAKRRKKDEHATKQVSTMVDRDERERSSEKENWEATASMSGPHDWNETNGLTEPVSLSGAEIWGGTDDWNRAETWTGTENWDGVENWTGAAIWNDSVHWNGIIENEKGMTDNWE